MAYEFELDEWRSAVREMTEVERVEACGHSGRGNRICPDCGHDARDEQ